MNKKMIVYILGKMLGTEGLLLLIPAVVPTMGMMLFRYS